MSAAATETCKECQGRGWGCPVCLGFGRVKVPHRSCIEDDRDDESDQLRAKLEIATKALQRIFDHGATHGCCPPCTDVAEEALEALKK